MEDILLEIVANQVHEQWSGWMRYLFSQTVHVMKDDESVDVVIPPEFYNRWKRQMITAYGNLSEKEKNSDRELAQIIINLIREESE